MNIDFNKISIIFAVILSLLVGILSWMLEFSPPKINNIQLEGKSDQANFINQKIIIEFNTPMNSESVAANLSITPSTEFELFWSQTSLNVSFKKVLSASTKYSLKISKDAKDIYNDKIDKDFTFDFTTKDDLLAYIERSDDSTVKNSKIILTDTQFSFKNQLFTGADIDFFELNSDYLVVVQNPTNSYSTLTLKNLNTLTEEKIEIGQSRITFLDLSPTENKFIYIIQNVFIQNKTVIPKLASEIFLFDASNKKSQKIDNPETAADVLQAFFSPDGKGLVIKGSDSGYFFQSLMDNTALDLGKHLDVRGFNSQKNKIMFIDAPFQSASAAFPSISTVDGKGTIENVTDGTNYAIDPQFFYSSEKIVFSEKVQELEGTKGLFAIKTYDLPTDEKKDIYFNSQYSSELPTLSYDDKYVIFEKYSQKDLSSFEGLRNFSFQSKPYNANLVIIDLTTLEVIDKGIRGVNAVWVR